jgi:hypothetical protein
MKKKHLILSEFYCTVSYDILYIRNQFKDIKIISWTQFKHIKVVLTQFNITGCYDPRIPLSGRNACGGQKLFLFWKKTLSRINLSYITSCVQYHVVYYRTAVLKLFSYIPLRYINNQSRITNN